MKKKKVRAKKARVDTPLEELNEKETMMHYNAILMEDVDSKYKLILELVKPIPAILEDLSALKDAVRSNSERLSTVELAIRGLKGDMLDMEQRLSSKINRIIDRCENHECRLTTLETSQ